MNIQQDAKRLHDEMMPRVKALTQWLDSQEIPVSDREPFLAYAAGYFLAGRKSKEECLVGTRLLDMFIHCGTMRAIKRHD